MKHTVKEQEVQHTGGNAASVVAGIVIGGLAGAGAALLFAPQSGRETREQIQQKTIELRDRTTETVDHAVSDVKARTHKLTDDVQHQVEKIQNHGQEVISKQVGKIQHRGQEVIAEQLDHVASAAQAGRDAIAPE
jgi:gas vesicle protein